MYHQRNQFVKINPGKSILITWRHFAFTPYFRFYLFALDNPPSTRLLPPLPITFDSISLVLNELNSIIVHYIHSILSNSIRVSKILACDKFLSIPLRFLNFISFS